MGITPVVFGSSVNQPASSAVEVGAPFEGWNSGANFARNRIADRALGALDFASKLDEILEQIRLDGERLLMYGDDPQEEAVDQGDGSSESGSVDLTTYQMVLEAGQKTVIQTSPLPESSLRLFA